MTKDFKDVIIAELEVMRQQEMKNRNTFKARAYAKVISELKALSTPIHTMADTEGIDGIGDKIKAKIQEIISTGELAAAERIRHDSKTSIFNDLIKIHGVGPVKANAIINYSANGSVKTIRSIADLREAVVANPKLLNDVQKIGLKHYEDLMERIPREEMKTHDSIIEKAFKQVNRGFQVTLVGSYRRELPASGDIDVLVCLPTGTDAQEQLFKDAVKKLQADKYIVDILALGPKKCMAVVKTESGTPARRLDILLTTPEEYPYAILYFTGSDKFNISFRKKTLEKGYSLSEHGAKKVREDVPDVPPMLIKKEEDIFSFFGIPYVEPKSR